MAVIRSPIIVDGAHGEGGGGLVRTALVMSCLTQQPLKIDGVRGGTKYPGLDFEDLILLRALEKICGAQVTGGEVGSNTIAFAPSHRPKGLNADLDLPGELDRSANAPVILSTLLPVLARTGVYSEVSLRGETYGNRSLSFDYFQNVTLPCLQKMGLYAFADQERAGFGRESRGRLRMEIEPSALQSIDWPNRGSMIRCHALVTTGELQSGIASRAMEHLRNLAQHAKIPLDIDSNPVDSHGPGAFITLWAVFERGIGGSTAMGRRGLRVEALAQNAFEAFLEWLRTDATVDPFVADQILVTACLAEGETTFATSSLTQRFLTSVSVIKQFLPIHITVRGVEGQAGTVSIKR